MKNNTTIIPFLKELSKNEMIQLEGFVKFKKPKSKKMLKFVKYLKKCYPDFPDNQIEKTTIVQKIGVLTIKDVSNLITLLRPILEEFLCYLQMQKEEKTEEVARGFLYLNWLKDKNDLINNFFKEAARLEKEWSIKEKQGIENLLNIYQLKIMVFTHPGFLKQNKFSTEPKAILDLFEKYTTINRLYWLLILYFNKRHTKDKKKQEADILSKDILQLEDSEIEDPQIKLLQEIVKMVREEDGQDYEILHKMFLEVYPFFNNHEITGLVSFLTQICYKNYQKGKTNSLKNLFEINKFSVEQGMVIQNNTISSDVFHNIINIACAAGELDWIEKFIAEKGEYLGKNEEEAGIALGNARYHFEKEEYEDVEELLLNIKLPTIFYKLQVKALVLMTYFEMQSNLFDSRLDAFYQFLNTNEELSTDYKKSFKNFIKFIRNLNKNRGLKDHKKITLLQDNIKSCSNVVHKAWLMKKAEEQL